MTKSEAIETVAMLMACYPTAQFPEGTVAAYEAFLSELELDRTRAAIRDIVRTSRFMPTIADIVSAYEALAPRKPETHYPLFKPAPSGRNMPPAELKAAIDEFLRKSSS